MKFDTRDEKPKLYDVLILSVLAVIVIGAAILTDVPAAGICVILVLYLAAVLVLILSAFVKQLQYNPYSYNTIFYFGFSLFVLSVLVTHVILTTRIVLYPGMYHKTEILRLLLSSAEQYMLLSFPFILAFSIALCISNISLIRHEGKRLVNVLGIILSFCLVIGALLLYRLDFYVSGSAREIFIRELFTRVYAAVYLYFECMLIGAIAAGAIVSRCQPEPDKDFLIILGCGLRKDGTPTPLLRGRIDRAVEFARWQKEETGKDLTFITSGGQGPDEIISESRSMKTYLLSQGIPEERIIEEDQSRTTFENMSFSKEKIFALKPEGKTAFATTNYHVFRSGLFARRVKLRALGVGAKTKWYFWPNAAVREFVGLLTAHRLKQFLILTGVIAAYVILTILCYRQF